VRDILQENSTAVNLMARVTLVILCAVIGLLVLSNPKPARAQQLGRFVCLWEDSTRVYDSDRARGNGVADLDGNPADPAAEFELHQEGGQIKLIDAPSSMADSRVYRVIVNMRGRELASSVALAQSQRSGAVEVLVFMYDSASGRYGLTLSSSEYVAPPREGATYAVLDVQLAHCKAQFAR
jgi:hypothetical protein